MLPKNSPNAIKISKLYIALFALLVATQPPITPANCKSYGSITNSSLKSQTIFRYSRGAALSLPIHQTRDQCKKMSEACKETKDCCQTTADGELSCGKSGGPSSDKTCQQCKGSNSACDISESETTCCFGLQCYTTKIYLKFGICGSTDNCIEESKACYPTHPCCCDGLNCIVDNEGKSYCSKECSLRKGDCTTSNKDACCPGLFCNGTNRCDCESLDGSCTPGADPTICCPEFNCDATSKSCKTCIAPNDLCNQPGETRTCCSSLPCSNTGRCCIAENAKCNPDSSTPKSTCCEGYYCTGPVGSETCNCIKQGFPCTPASASCCGDNNQCTTTSTASFCGPCVMGGNPCDNASGVDTCCDGYKCGNVGKDKVCLRDCEIGDPCQTNEDCCFDLVCGILDLESVCLDDLIPEVLR